MYKITHYVSLRTVALTEQAASSREVNQSENILENKKSISKKGNKGGLGNNCKLTAKCKRLLTTWQQGKCCNFQDLFLKQQCCCVVIVMLFLYD